MMRVSLFVSSCLLAATAFAAEPTMKPTAAPPAPATPPMMAAPPKAPMPPTPPAPAPEVKKTVDAFVGNWKVDAAITPPGAPAPVKFKAKIACKKISAGKAVGCALTAKVPQMGAYEANVMVAWDPYSKAVHFMSISSDDEVHDHKCAWKDDKTLSCEPLKGGSMGQAITEELSFTWDGPKSMTHRSTTTFGDGSKVVFEGTGKK